jgi:CelD/BcsL family acetyltransferase involved in cellulose biosynthesis
LDVTLETADLEPAFDEFISLHNLRWGRRHDTFTSYLRAIAHRFLPIGRLLLARLTLDGRTIAAKYDFLYDGKVWGYQGGWLPELRKLEIGNALIAEILKYSILRGFKSYDFLEGDEWYKRRWSTARLESRDLALGDSASTFIF